VDSKQISVGGFLHFSFVNLRKNWLMFIGLSALVGAAFIAYFLVTSGLTWLVGRITGYNSVILGLLGVLFAVGGIVLGMTVMFAFLKNILNLCRGQMVDFKTFVQVKPMVILNFAIGVIIVNATVSFGTFMFVVPGIILAYLLCLVPYLIIDRELGPVKAIDESYKLTKDHLMDMFIVTFIGSVIAGLLSIFIITLLITIPMMCLMAVYLYLQLTGQLEAAQKQFEAQAAAQAAQAAAHAAQAAQAAQAAVAAQEENKQA